MKIQNRTYLEGKYLSASVTWSSINIDKILGVKTDASIIVGESDIDALIHELEVIKYELNHLKIKQSQG